MLPAEGADHAADAVRERCRRARCPMMPAAIIAIDTYVAAVAAIID